MEPSLELKEASLVNKDMNCKLPYSKNPLNLLMPERNKIIEGPKSKISTKL